MLRLILLCTIVSAQISHFDIPKLKFEVYYPKGLKVTLPDISDADGVQDFRFKARVNERIDIFGGETATISAYVEKPVNGSWAFYDPTVQLKVGDVVYYLVHVQRLDAGWPIPLRYTQINKRFDVTELIGQVTTSTTAATPEKECKCN